jgi:hypothetical protein
VLGAGALAAEVPDLRRVESIRIWKAGAPDSDAAHWPRADYHEEWERPGQILGGVTEPTIQAFLPEAKLNTGAAVVLCPGLRRAVCWLSRGDPLRMAYVRQAYTRWLTSGSLPQQAEAVRR